MNTRLLLAVALLASFAANARASFYFTWNAPGAVNVGQNYTVGVQAYFTPSYSGDPYATLGLYRNGSQVGGGGTSAYGSATASNSFTDNSPQTVGYSADIYSYYGESDYSSHSVTVNGAPANNPPTAWVTVDGWSHGATVIRPYGGSVSVTVRYKASDPDNNLARIRPQVWHPSGYLNNNGGNFIGQSGGYGEVAWTVNLNENGNWHFWTDAEDTNNVFVNSGAWSAGFRLTVVEGAPPNSPPTVVLHSPSAQTIYLNQALTITSQATDPDNNIAHHNLDIQRPDGSWNWQGGFANGHPYTGGYNGSPGNSNRSASFTFNQLGTWYVRSAAADSSGWYHSATVAINVVNAPDTTPPGNPHNLQVSNLTSSSFTLSWSAPSDNVGVTGYRVRLNEGAATNVSGLSHTFSGLAANTNYAAQVSARDAEGNWSGWAGAGAATGSSGSGGTQAESSVWRDIMGGDGILDEIVRAGTAEFNYYVNEWYTTNYSYAYLPINNYWHWWKIFWEPQTYYENFTSSWEHSHQFWVSYDAFFELAFEIGISYNHPFRIYRDRSASEQINLSEWELLINTVGSPGGFTMISYPLQDPADLPGTQYFMVKLGYGISGATVRDSNGTVLASNVGAGGTATLNLPSNGQLMIETINVQGEEIPIEEGKHTLTWIIEGVANVANNVINGVGKVLDLAGIVPLSNNQVVVKLKLDNSDQYFTFVLVLPNVWKIEILDKNKNPVSQLKVAKLTESGALYAEEGSSLLDIDSDSDRFYIRVIDPVKRGTNPKVLLWTESSSTSYSDTDTDPNKNLISLEDDPANSSALISKSLILMADDVDDDKQVGGVSDNALNDRTRKVGLGGSVHAEYLGYKQEASRQADVSAAVPIRKVVRVSIVILRLTPGDVPSVSQSEVEADFRIAKERFAQIGMDLQLDGSIRTEDPPADVNLNDIAGLDVAGHFSYDMRIVKPEARKLIETHGTEGNNLDIHVFYVPALNAWGGLQRGAAVADFWFDASEDDFIYNAFLAEDRGLFDLAHELAHLFADQDHFAQGTDSDIRINLLKHGTSPTNHFGATKRLNADQESRIHSNSRVQNPSP